MILLEKTTSTSDNSPLNLTTTKDEKNSLSFSQLLKGINEQEGVLSIDEKQETPLKKNFSSLLLNSETSESNKSIKTKNTQLPSSSSLTQTIDLNPEVIVNLTPKEMKQLIADAKKYLKDKILQSDDYKISQAKDLPKTLKGLVNVAQKLGIDMAKISLEEVKAELKSPIKTELKPEINSQVKPPIKTEVKPEINSQVKSPIKTEVKPELNSQEKPPIKSEVKPEIKSEVKPEVKSAIKQEVKPELNSQVKSPIKTEVKPEINSQEKSPIKTEVKAEINSQEKPPIKTEVKAEIKSEVKPEVKSAIKQEIKPELKPEPSTDPKATNDPKVELKAKNTPLFKVLAQPQVVSTEQTIQVREQKVVEPKSAKQRANDTLKLLLRGDKVSKSDAPLKMTSDFSVATARVIAPSSITESQKSLESLLKGEVSETLSSKEHGINLPKSDSFEVKINEAKQLNKYLSQDVKQAIDDYKSPFTRIKVQLNPQKLGEVDLTVIQRGKNLHVNISSNNIAINTLAMNANDLKVQLNNSGIQNATLNFNSGSSDGNNAQQQQNQQQNQHASREYNYFDHEEKNEEIINSLEIVVPQYG